MTISSPNLSQTHTYQAYLIRMWRSSPDTIWRASAQHAQSGEIVFFADLEQLFRFLHDQAIEPRDCT